MFKKLFILSSLFAVLAPQAEAGFGNSVQRAMRKHADDLNRYTARAAAEALQTSETAKAAAQAPAGVIVCKNDPQAMAARFGVTLGPKGQLLLTNGEEPENTDEARVAKAHELVGEYTRTHYDPTVDQYVRLLRMRLGTSREGAEDLLKAVLYKDGLSIDRLDADTPQEKRAVTLMDGMVRSNKVTVRDAVGMISELSGLPESEVRGFMFARLMRTALDKIVRLSHVSEKILGQVPIVLREALATRNTENELRRHRGLPPLPLGRDFGIEAIQKKFSLSRQEAEAVFVDVVENAC